MKKTIMILLVLFMVSPFAYSADNYVVGKVGIFQPNDFVEGTNDFDNGETIGFAVGRMLNSNLAVEVGLDYTNTKYTEINDGIDPNVELKTIGVPLNIKAFAPINDKINFFAGVGIGCFYSNIKIRTDGFDDKCTGYTVGYQAMTGVDYKLNDKMALTTELKYTSIDQKGLSGVLDIEDVEVGGLSGSVGVKMGF